MSDDAQLTSDERAAMRAFLQRCDVRLSTMHRVATALLSGAGILVLLPAVERDSVVQVLRSLLVGSITWSRGLLLVAVVLSIGLALAVLWLVIIELTRFYFHANHVVHDGAEVFTPRFTLTGLRLPTDELAPEVNRAYDDMHVADRTVRLLVPSNARSRERIDRQMAAYPGLIQPSGHADRDRAAGLFELAASERRTLVEECAKVEYGMVRHMLRLQVIVLRYVKALLVIVLTAMAAFTSAAAVNGETTVTGADQRWIAATFLIWAPAVLIVVSSPVRWLESLLRSEGAVHSGIRDPELTKLEDVTAKVSAVAWLSSLVAMVLLLVRHPVSTQGWVGSVLVLMFSTALAIVAFAERWQRRRVRPA